MYGFLSVIIVIVCILLVLVVLVQNSKGGGLAANFSSSNQVMGVRKTADFLEKATWTLAVTLIVLSVLSSWSIDKVEEGNAEKSRLENVVQGPIQQNMLPETPGSFDEAAE